MNEVNESNVIVTEEQTKKKKAVPGKKLTLIGFIIAIVGLIEKFSFVFTYEFLIEFEKSIYEGQGYIVDTSISDLLAQLFTAIYQVCAIVGGILAVIGIILFFAKKNKETTKKTPLVFGIIGIVAAILSFLI